MKYRRIPLVALAFASLASLAAATATATTSSLTVKMNALNGSGESGTVTLTQESNGVEVVFKLDNAKGSQPAHIHEGTCSNLNPSPLYPLSNVVNGTSTSELMGVKIDQLLAGHYAINVHKSAADLATYVSCGDIVAPT